MKRFRPNLIVVLFAALVFGLAFTRDRQAELSADSRYVREEVRAVDLTAAERRWEKIGWVSNVTDALTLSQQLRRPTVIIGHIGDLDGRC